MNYVKLSWSNIEKMCNDIATKIKESGFQPDVIIALGRGGMIPARILSDILGVSTVYMFGIKLYTGVGTRGNIKTESFCHIIEKKKVLLIDDILDSGKTIEKSLEILKTKRPTLIKVATLFCKKNKPNKPTYFASDSDEDSWYIFPWENSEFLSV